jgi:hypothetical protein
MKTVLIALFVAATLAVAEEQQPAAAAPPFLPSSAPDPLAARLAALAADPEAAQRADRHGRAVRAMKTATVGMGAHRHHGSCPTGFDISAAGVKAIEKRFEVSACTFAFGPLARPTGPGAQQRGPAAALCHPFAPTYLLLHTPVVLTSLHLREPPPTRRPPLLPERTVPRQTHRCTQSDVVERFGADSAQARAFIPAADLSRLAAAGGAGAPTAAQRRAPAADPALLAQLTDAVVHLQSADAAGAGARRRLLSLTMDIKVYVHAVQMTDGTGFVSDAAITDQVNALTNAYSSFGITLQFQLALINRITSDAIFGFDGASKAGYLIGEGRDARIPQGPACLTEAAAPAARRRADSEPQRNPPGGPPCSWTYHSNPGLCTRPQTCTPYHPPRPQASG